MAVTLYNRAGMTTTTTGTGTLTLGNAITDPKTYLSFSDAGVPNGATVPYLLEDGVAFELGEGVYTSSGTTLTRATVSASSNGGSKIDLDGSARVYISARAGDIDRPPIGCLAFISPTLTLQNYSALTALPFNNETYDDAGIHDNVTQNTRMTVPAGYTKARLTGSITVSAVTSGSAFAIGFQHFNSAGAAQSTPLPGINTPANAYALAGGNLKSARFTVTPGDYCTFYLQCADVSISIEASSTWFAMELWP